MLKTKLVSSLEKCFIDDDYNSFDEVKKINIYKNTDAAFQFLAFDEAEADVARQVFKIKAEGDLKEFVSFREVCSVPNYIAAKSTPKTAMEQDPDYLRAEPGLYPDVLTELYKKELIMVLNQQLHPIWIDVKNNGTFSTGEHELTIQLFDEQDNFISENKIIINVIDVCLPEQKTKVTQWFYADCLADYYEVDVWSDRHFEICKNFIKTAVENGINMILLPAFTPPLDTAVGGERTTTQLVKVTKENGKYSFDFSLVDRWIAICKECNVKYFEIAHLFTQWGAYHAPKIIATVDGKEERIFGWETDADSADYVEFLNLFLAEFTKYLEQKGLKDSVYFHISDEPNETHVEQYKINHKNIEKVLSGWKVLDALSHVEFYQQGLCEIPVPVSFKIEQFLSEDIKERWIYYCCNPYISYSNRFMCMHSARTRFMGIQMYKYDIEGFLHWGYNFYNCQYSYSSNNPFLNGNAGYFAGGGDAVSVYPGKKGIPLESLRIIAFKQGLEDIRALELCEKFYKKEEIVLAIEKIYGENIVFEKCVNDTKTMQKIRDRIDEMIIKKL